jgi:hypothetical protein
VSQVTGRPGGSDQLIQLLGFPERGSHRPGHVLQGRPKGSHSEAHGGRFCQQPRGWLTLDQSERIGITLELDVADVALASPARERDEPDGCPGLEGAKNGIHVGPAMPWESLLSCR